MYYRTTFTLSCIILTLFAIYTPVELLEEDLLAVEYRQACEASVGINSSPQQQMGSWCNYFDSDISCCPVDSPSLQIPTDDRNRDTFDVNTTYIQGDVSSIISECYSAIMQLRCWFCSPDQNTIGVSKLCTTCGPSFSTPNSTTLFARIFKGDNVVWTPRICFISWKRFWRNCADAIRYPSGKTLEQVFVGGNPLIVEQQLLNQDTYCFPSLSQPGVEDHVCISTANCYVRPFPLIRDQSASDSARAGPVLLLIITSTLLVLLFCTSLVVLTKQRYQRTIET